MEEKLITSKKKSIYKLTEDASSQMQTTYKAIDQHNQIFHALQAPIAKVNVGIIKQCLSITINAPSSYLYMPVDYAKENDAIYIIYPYHDSTLSELIKEGRINTESLSLQYFRQICYAHFVAYQNGYISKGLSEKDILITNNSDKKCPIKTVAVSNIFSIDQLAQLNPISSNPSDSIFELGCLLFKLLCSGNVPINIKDNPKASSIIGIASRFTSPLSKLSLYLLEGCLQTNSCKRFTPSQLYKEMQFDSFFKLLQIGGLDPEQKISISKLTKLPINIKESSEELNCMHSSSLAYSAKVEMDVYDIVTKYYKKPITKDNMRLIDTQINSLLTSINITYNHKIDTQDLPSIIGQLINIPLSQVQFKYDIFIFSKLLINAIRLFGIEKVGCVMLKAYNSNSYSVIKYKYPEKEIELSNTVLGLIQSVLSDKIKVDKDQQSSVLNIYQYAKMKDLLSIFINNVDAVVNTLDNLKFWIDKYFLEEIVKSDRCTCMKSNEIEISIKDTLQSTIKYKI